MRKGTVLIRRFMARVVPLIWKCRCQCTPFKYIMAFTTALRIFDEQLITFQRTYARAHATLKPTLPWKLVVRNGMSVRTMYLQPTEILQTELWLLCFFVLYALRLCVCRTSFSFACGGNCMDYNNIVLMGRQTH